jgi:hypothetical protein
MNNYVSLDIAEKLKWRFPVSQSWHKPKSNGESKWTLIHIQDKNYMPCDENQCPAPSIAELLAELPFETSLEKVKVGTETEEIKIGYCVSSRNDNRNLKKYVYFVNDNPADALAELYMWLQKERG